MPEIKLPKIVIKTDVEFSLFEGLKELPADTTDLLTREYIEGEGTWGPVKLVSRDFTWRAIRGDISALAVVHDSRIVRNPVRPFGIGGFKKPYTDKGLQVTEAPVVLRIRTFPYGERQFDRLAMNVLQLTTGKVKPSTYLLPWDIFKNLGEKPDDAKIAQLLEEVHRDGIPSYIKSNPNTDIFDVIYPMDVSYLKQLKGKILRMDSDDEGEDEFENGPLDIGPISTVRSLIQV